MILPRQRSREAAKTVSSGVFSDCGFEQSSDGCLDGLTPAMSTLSILLFATYSESESGGIPKGMAFRYFALMRKLPPDKD